LSRDPSKVKVIAFANQKGGVAKTTTTLNLAVAFAEKGFRVLCVDMDPQGNLTMSQGIDPDGLTESMFDVLVHDMPIRQVIRKREVDIACASIDLAGAEIAMSMKIGRERSLEKAFRPIADDYDFICIDTPPSLGLLTINALTAADKVIVPVQCEYLSMRGLVQLQNTLHMIRENLNPDVQIEGILPTLLDTRTTHAKEAIELLEENFGDRVFASRIRKTVRFAEAPVKGMSVLKYDPDGTAAQSYRDLAKEVLAHASSRRPERASLREGPLADLFRRTEEAQEESVGAPRRPPPPSRPRPRPRRRPSRCPPPSPATAAGPGPRGRGLPAPEPRGVGRPCHPEEAPRVPSPNERLRHAFTSEIPPDVLEPPGAARDRVRGEDGPAGPAARRAAGAAAPRRAARGSTSRAGGRSPSYDRAGSGFGTGTTGAGHPVIRVVGVGGAGVNAVNRMVEAEVQGVEFLAINTDVQSLQGSTADITLHIGPGITRGLGAARTPTWGARARWRSTTRSRRCSRAPTWSSSPRAPAAGRARAPRPWWPASPRSSGR
jgi:chromosome partitioning protein